MAATPRKPRGTRASKFEDPYPRTKPQEREEPADWPMVQHYVEHALHGCKSENKSTPIRDDVEYNLKKALDHLFPTPSE